MSDLILLSNLPTPSSRVLQALDNAGLQTVDLLTLDVFEVHRRTQLSVIDVQNLVRDVISILTGIVEGEQVKTAEERYQRFSFLTTGDEKINELLGGGIPIGSLTEVTGESGLGKSQLCLQLCIHVQLPRSLGGLDGGAIYIGTESSLATPRLSQISESLKNTLTTSPPSDIPTSDIETALKTLSSYGDRILYFHCPNLEAQDHIVTYQLPVVLSRHRIGLILLDSVTANYRAEFDPPQPFQRSQSHATQMAQRSKDLRKMAGTLKDLAIKWNVAVVAVNQVTDAFKRPSSQSSGATPDEDLLSSDYQGKWFDGLIDENGVEGTKKPALGLVWTNLISSRIMLVRENDGRSRIKVVFSPFAKQGSLFYGISTKIGVHAIQTPQREQKEVTVEHGGNMNQESISNNLDFKVFDGELSDFDAEDILSGQPNV